MIRFQSETAHNVIIDIMKIKTRDSIEFYLKNRLNKEIGDERGFLSSR